ncbi:uncharacterized protein BYT42DRAFT_604834 [Radiomyces spectabilis]|uniref:uncharacterized protein n=1 Tax=Radiomyces spectabilis TaxID=64574 RepID=UPI00221EF8BE|nr:uncharacterized protein BYT42DRAFT_604834 [Radiomyces spectabilis]KAI8379467.1 hypothetical protein BYT42DRAFT_604834 [Radiomyces spectabilis]
MVLFQATKPYKPAPPISYHEMLFSNKHRTPAEQPIYIDAATKRTVTYGELQTLIRQYGAGLYKQDMQVGDVIAVCAPNSVDYAVLFHSILASGGIMAALDRASDEKAIYDDLETVDARFVVAHPSTLDKVLRAATRFGIPKERIWLLGEPSLDSDFQSVNQALLDHDDILKEFPTFTPDELDVTPAMLYFTSGSTGRKKAVNLSHRVVCTSITQRDWWMPGTRNISFTEFHHGSALMITFSLAVYSGIPTYIMTEFDFKTFCRLVEEHAITFVALQPWIAAKLAKDPIVDQHDLSSLNFVLSAGAALDPAIMKAVYQRLGIKILNMWGMTEALGVMLCSPDESAQGYAGKLAPGFEAKLVSQEGQELDVGDTGELWVRGPTVTPGYYRNPEATAKAIDSDGFLHTGDIFKVTNDGYFVFMDREKDLIKYHLYHIKPSEIETVLIKLPEVADCAVIGVYNSDQATELPRAYVMLANGCEYKEGMEKEIQDHVDSQLADKYHLRGGVVIMKDLPRTTTGKTNRPALREIARNEAVVAV